MKKYLVIAGLAVAAVVAVAFASCTTTNTTNQAADNATAEATPVPVGTLAASPTPTATPQPTATAAEVKNRVYTNEKFGYKITLPAGYTAEKLSRTGTSGVSSDQDKVTVKNPAGEEFAVIHTPMNEVGYELWEIVEDKELSVPGSDIKLHWRRGEPDAAMGETDAMVLVEWEKDGDFTHSGSIFLRYAPSDTSRLNTFQTMINSLRFI